jgi:hypothetical protein
VNFERRDGLDAQTVWDTDPSTSSQAQQRHLLQVRHLDGLVGGMLDDLDRAGTYDDALIVVTADHGVAFTPGEPRRRISDGNVGEVAYVPLFVKLPHQDAGRVDDRPMQTVDVLATIADALGVDLPEPTDGVSGLAREHPEVARVMYDARLGRHALPSGFEPLRDAVAAKLERFAASGGDLYAPGVYGALVGAPAPPSARADDVELTVDGVDSYADVDLGRSLVPAFPTGQVRVDGSAPPEPVDLAVALNGTIAGVTRSFAFVDGGTRWSAVLDPALLRDGANRLDVYVVSGPASDPVLTLAASNRR